MGGEFAQEREWNHDRELDWQSARRSCPCRGSAPVRDLNRLYGASRRCIGATAMRAAFIGQSAMIAPTRCLHSLRLAPDQPPILVVCNMTPVPRHGYRIGVPHDGRWREILNSNSGYYGGSNVGNDGSVEAVGHHRAWTAASLRLVLPPLATIFLRHEG